MPCGGKVGNHISLSIARPAQNGEDLLWGGDQTPAGHTFGEMELVEFLVLGFARCGADGAADHAKGFGLFAIPRADVARALAEIGAGAAALHGAAHASGGAGVLVAEEFCARLFLRPLLQVRCLALLRAGLLALRGHEIVLMPRGVFAGLGCGVVGGQQEGEDQGKGWAHGGEVRGTVDRGQDVGCAFMRTGVACW